MHELFPSARLVRAGVLDHAEMHGGNRLGTSRSRNLRRDEYSELIYGNYRVIYRVAEQRVNIVTVRNGRQLRDTAETEKAA